jgi:hypothetical protein
MIVLLVSSVPSARMSMRKSELIQVTTLWERLAPSQEDELPDRRPSKLAHGAPGGNRWPGAALSHSTYCSLRSRRRPTAFARASPATLIPSRCAGNAAASGSASF